MSANPDERLTVLKMIEDQKITAEQGALLLGAMNKPAMTNPEQQSIPQPQDLPLPADPGSQAAQKRRFRVLVTDTQTGKNKVSVSLPISLVRWGLRTGVKFSDELDGLDVDTLADLLEGGEDGQIVEVFDEEDGEHVRVFIE